MEAGKPGLTTAIYFHNIGIMEMSSSLACLAALGHESRLRAFRRLVEAGPDGLPVGELREHLDLPPATLSAHLNVLRAADLVHDQREGRVIRVRANYGRMDALIAYLTENCCAGSGACSPMSSACTTRKKGASI
jgi:DNA-binding transcriptional ArsR family regulator